MTDGQKTQITLLRQEGLGYTAVAKKTGLPKDTVKSFCRRNGLTGKLAEQGQDVETQDGQCRECGKPLQQTEGMKRRVFCCEECRVKWWREHPDRIKQKAVYSFGCACCGKEFTAYGNSRRKYCSHECYIKDRFKGGGADD
ncbi:MAG: RNA polymerase subunit sigma-70 [Lachnospiraceae bacterium]|nr:RNA polymerase subunit sigma-70 [Lachnospiraceae bacterium]